jgi:hypothetical protein
MVVVVVVGLRLVALVLSVCWLRVLLLIRLVALVLGVLVIVFVGVAGT